MTKKLTRRQKTTAAFGRAFVVAGMRPRMVSRLMRAHWRNILMPWRMLPAPMAWALIGLVALAMLLDYGEGNEGADANAAAPSPTVTVAAAPTVAGATITLTLGQYIPGETPCEEDAVYDTVGEECIHVDRISAPFPTGTVAQPTGTVSPAPSPSPIP